MLRKRFRADVTFLLRFLDFTPPSPIFVLYFVSPRKPSKACKFSIFSTVRVSFTLHIHLYRSLVEHEVRGVFPFSFLHFYGQHTTWFVAKTRFCSGDFWSFSIIRYLPYKGGSYLFLEGTLQVSPHDPFQWKKHMEWAIKFQKDIRWS